MKKLLPLLLSFIFSPSLFAQNKVNPNWVVRNPYEQKVFIENNEGQFDGETGNDTTKILFCATIDGLSLFFTPAGVIYRYTEPLKIGKEQFEELEKKGREQDIPKPLSHYLSCKWLGGVTHDIIAKDEVSFYYCYPKSEEHTTVAHAFKKLLYKDIYPGIDVEYSFPQDKPGIKYSVIVHPNADLSNVRLLYSDALSINQTVKGDVEIQSVFGKFINHSPSHTFYKEDSDILHAYLKLNGNSIAFNAGDYDKSKTLMIDPWAEDPVFANYDAAYALRYDYQGNVYVYGNGSPSQNENFQLEKLDGNGNIKWVYTSPYNFSIGDLAVDKVTGSSYISGFASNNGFTGILHVSSKGLLKGHLYVQWYSTELWKMDFDNCTRQIIIGAGGNGTIQQGVVLDTGFLSYNPVNFLNAYIPTHDIALLTVDEANGYCYMATSKSLNQEPYNFNNVVSKCPIPALMPVSFTKPDGFSFSEAESVRYVQDNSLGSTNGFNGAAVSPNWLYLYDGATLKRFDKNFGIVNKILSVSSTPFAWGGLDVDACDDIYVGNNTSINIYDSLFDPINTISLPDTVYDLRLGHNNLVYACGYAFVSAYSVPVTPPLQISFTTSPACSGCNGTALAKIMACNANKAKYLWSDGQTTQLATGLCGGRYKLSIDLGESCTPYIDSIDIIASSNPAVQVPNSTITQVSCIGEENGSATAVASGGTPPFTYTWLPMGTPGPALDNIGEGTYSVFVSDANGCAGTASLVMNPKDYQLFVPDAFSPNGDGQNDVLYVRCNCIKSMDFMIFDRWGNKVFETENINEGWDGLHNGLPMNTGTYVYYLTATMFDGSTVEKKGNVALVR